nr:MAG TPA: hypothetical protein [Caudoviricetes sp.]
MRQSSARHENMNDTCCVRRRGTTSKWRVVLIVKY